MNFHATVEVFDTNTDYQQRRAIIYIIFHVPTHDYSTLVEYDLDVGWTSTNTNFEQ